MPQKEKLNAKDREELNECYRKLARYHKLRKEGVDCWADYYSTLKRIKHILRYR